MSFQTVCDNCGATSGPSLGICPYCKSVMTGAGLEKSQTPAYSTLLKLYSKGQIESALTYIQEVLRSTEKYEDDPALLLLCSKIMIESEGPNGRTRALLGMALMKSPNNTEINDYLEIIQARFELSSDNCQKGVEILERVLRHSPENPHALFTLGAHLFWHDKNSVAAIPYLERCLRVRPQFLRAWACLAAISKELDNPQLAATAFQKCVALETNGKMRKFFQEQLELLSSRKKAA